MTLLAAHVRVLNSLLYIRDAGTKDLPIVDGNGAYWSTPSCVAVCCLPDCDGATEIIIGATNELPLSGSLLFDGWLNTSSHNLIVETVLAEKILERSVPDIRTRVRIWTNGFRATDKVIVGLG